MLNPRLVMKEQLSQDRSTHLKYWVRHNDWQESLRGRCPWGYAVASCATKAEEKLLEESEYTLSRLLTPTKDN